MRVHPAEYDVLVVGAGAAGVGVGVALRDAGVQSFALLERRTVGASFDAWPAETRFITPSFATNSVGMLDLNSIAVGVSPAFSLGVEHPTGEEYAGHLRGVARYFELPVFERVEVQSIATAEGGFVLETNRDSLRAKHVIWAAGEFQYPLESGFAGIGLCRHTATIPSYEDLEGDGFVVIGGYESGVDAAYHLACGKKQLRLLDAGNPWQSESSDPSVALSPYSLERMRSNAFQQRVSLHPNAPVVSVTCTEAGYSVKTEDGARFDTAQPPLLAHGFAGSHRLVADLFEPREDGFPLLNEHDESTLTPNLFLCGPAVRHGELIFCFIYKYRQRFAVVAKAIATALGLPALGLEMYRTQGMFLDDLSCCSDECAAC